MRGVANSSRISDELFPDDLDDAQARGEDREVFLDLLADLLQLVGDLVAAERGQARKPQLEDGLGLLLGQLVGALVGDLVARVGDQHDKRGDVVRRPVALHQLLARGSGARRVADELDHLVDVGDGDGEADEDVGTLTRLRQQELGAAADHFLAEVGESLDHVLEIEALGPAAVDRQHVGAERGLQVREAVELIEHDVGHRIAL